jgi:hypothetical protein
MEGLVLVEGRGYGEGLSYEMRVFAINAALIRN